jgi:MAE_28990/MAE_18760-like HEPN
MRIRSISELVDILDEELAWRKRELTTLRFLIWRSRHHEQELMLRAGICILYAHWEGFVRSAGTAYVNYVALKRLKYCDLSPSMVALGIRGKLRAAEATNRITVHTEVTGFLMSDMRENAVLPWDDAVSARDNLNSEVLKEIVRLLDLDERPYETKKALLDERLLANRNRISHGQRLLIDRTDYDVLHYEILNLIDMFRDDVENAASIGRYYRVSSS